MLMNLQEEQIKRIVEFNVKHFQNQLERINLNINDHKQSNVETNSMEETSSDAFSESDSRSDSAR